MVPSNRAPLLCCFFAQFDNQTGPRITVEVPSGFLSPEFEEVSKIVIPKPFLCGSLVSVTRPRFTVLGFPVLLRNPKYHRNALLFNFGFVLAPGVSSEPYQLLLRKVGETLRAMEEESAFVSDSKNVAIIEGLCAACVRDLNASGECVAALDAGNALFLKLQPRLLLAAAPSLHAVPVSVVPLSALSSSSSWDLTVRRVALAMDGERCVRDIARATGVDPPLVAQAVRTLITFGVAAMTEPAGLQCSRYACTPRAAALCWSDLGRACCDALHVPVAALPRVALLYARLRPSQSLAATLAACAFPHDAPPFDVQRFITFGLLNDIIRRVQPYVYPVDGSSLSGTSIDEYLVAEGLPLDDKHFLQALERFSNDKYVILWK